MKAFPRESNQEGGWILSYAELMEVKRMAGTYGSEYGVGVPLESIEEIIRALEDIGYMKIDDSITPD